MPKVAVDRELIGGRMLLPTLVALLVVSALCLFSYYWNIATVRSEKVGLALMEAKANWQKDASFRKWATLHGGVYVRPDERTPPNPYLAHLPDRDVETTEGMRLTLMNPAFMMRQMTHEFEGDYGIKGKITGKVLINPINEADAWELNVLNVFESGDVTEVHEEALVEGAPYLRYMRAVFMAEGCIKCHGYLGFKAGDLRGGVSVSIPLTPYFNAASETGRSIAVTHVIVWCCAFISILLFGLTTRRLLFCMAHSACHDGLTQLPNKTLLVRRIQLGLDRPRAREGDRVAVCLMDLNRFKILNDSRGHHVGDKLLVELARRLVQRVGSHDTVARIGGDEFVILLEDVDGLDGALAAAQRVMHAFDTPFNVDGEEIFSDASLGVCVMTEVYRAPSELLRDADIAMYEAKAAGHGVVRLFNPEMHRRAKETLQLENDLRTALEKGQLDVYYQPVVDIQRGTIEGFEALLRWKHPELGCVSPERFIPIAERSGQICRIGRWVLERACAQVMLWSEECSPRQNFSIAVNLSGVQLSDPHILDIVVEVMQTTGIPRASLQLEVTETMLVGRSAQSAKAVRGIKALGPVLSIDDFGKGYCSLTYLQKFDFDILKVDKSFVQDMEPGSKGEQLTRALMNLAASLRMQVIAEGVETAAQVEQLRALGCSLVQGYYFSRPLPASEISALLARGCHVEVDRMITASA
jgi:diguanylate cyclase (GGDEF)-like protein